MSGLDTLKRILEKHDMELYNCSKGDAEAKDIRLGLGFYHGWKTEGKIDKDKMEVTRQTHQAVSGVVDDLVSEGLLTPEGAVFYELFRFMLPMEAAKLILRQGQELTNHNLEYVDIDGLRTPEDYRRFNLKREGSGEVYDHFTIDFNGNTYLLERLRGDSFAGVHDRLRKRGIPFIFPDEKESDFKRFQAVLIDKVPEDNPVRQQLQEERVGIYAKNLFSQRKGMQVLIAGYMDFYQKGEWNYNVHNHTYVFAVHKSVGRLA